MNAETFFLHDNTNWQDFQEKRLNELEASNPLIFVSI